jgi:hypothetical protein
MSLNAKRTWVKTRERSATSVPSVEPPRSFVSLLVLCPIACAASRLGLTEEGV